MVSWEECQWCLMLLRIRRGGTTSRSATRYKQRGVTASLGRVLPVAFASRGPCVS